MLLEVLAPVISTSPGLLEHPLQLLGHSGVLLLDSIPLNGPLPSRFLKSLSFFLALLLLLSERENRQDQGQENCRDCGAGLFLGLGLELGWGWGAGGFLRNGVGVLWSHGRWGCLVEDGVEG